MESYQASEELKRLADKVISDNEVFSILRDGKCRIAFQYSKGAKKSRGKTVYADTEMVKEKYKMFMPYDFVITFYEGNTCNLSESKMEKLMYHELKHVGYTPSDGKFSIIPHDIEDFRDVTDKWGIDWID